MYDEWLGHLVVVTDASVMLELSRVPWPSSIWKHLFKAQARIPPGLTKDLPKGGVVLLFPRSTLRCLVISSFRRSLCRGVKVR